MFKRSRSRKTEYGEELRAKQDIKKAYGLRERQFKNYVKESLRVRKEAANTLASKLESRLDNVVFRLGFAMSRAQARQLVNHRHILINGRVVNIPSYQLKKGDKVEARPQSRKSIYFTNIKTYLKNYNVLDWLSLDKENFSGTVDGVPTKELSGIDDTSLKLIFEFYSR